MSSNGLRALYEHCLARAARTGRDQRCPLAGGAAFAVRVRSATVTVTIYRAGKKLSDSEIVTFHTSFAIPADARRIPETGQGQREDRSYVAWRWLIATDDESPRDRRSR